MIGCLVIPYFAASVTRQAQPELARTPLIFARETTPGAQVRAVSKEAYHQGVRPGQTLKAARGLCPTAEVLPLENSRWRAAHERLLDLLWRFSDRVEPDPDPAGAISAAYYLDFGSLRLADTLRLCRQLQAEVQGELGLAGRVGLAGNKFPARVAALTSSEPVREVPAGTEGDFLASLPVRLLALDAEQAHRLALLGIHTLGQLAALPRSAMLAQLGPNGPLLHDLASGIDPRPLVPQRQPRQVTAFHEFEPPVDDRQILLATLEHLAGQLVEQLTASHEATRSVRLTLSLADGRTLADLRRPRQPVSAAEALQKQLVALFKKQTLDERVSGIEVCLGGLEPVMARQLTLFGEEEVQDAAAKAVEALQARHTGLAVYRVAAAAEATILPERRYRLEKVGRAHDPPVDRRPADQCPGQPGRLRLRASSGRGRLIQWPGSRAAGGWTRPGGRAGCGGTTCGSTPGPDCWSCSTMIC